MKILWVITALASGFLSSQSVWATPAQVLIIRHAEKPASGPHLSDAGTARAQALVGFFQNDSRFTHFGAPVAMYAMGPSSSTGTLRPIETLTPLAQALKMTLLASFRRGQESAIAQDVLNNPSYDGKVVLICWEHNSIPALAQALGVTQNVQWPGDAYDRVWELDYSNSLLNNFADLPQHLMPGDSPQ